jgi:RHS repeat-associated protein
VGLIGRVVFPKLSAVSRQRPACTCFPFPVRFSLTGTTYLDEKLLLKHSSGDEFYYLLGHLYTVGGLTDAGGSLVEWYSYTGYGLPTIHTVTTSPDNPFFFTGQRLDRLDAGALLVYDYKARVYDPLHGRFQQRDPSEFFDTYNLYEYVRSRPTVLVDPSGEFALPNITFSMAIRKGLTAFNAADMAYDVLAKARMLAAGASFQNVLLALVVEQALDKVGGHAFERALKLVQSVGRATRRAVYSNVAGTLAERAARIKGPKIAIRGIGRIPDEVVGDVIREVKFREGRHLAISDQLRQIAEWADNQGFTFELEVPVGTTFDKVLQELIDQGKIIVKETLP